MTSPRPDFRRPPPGRFGGIGGLFGGMGGRMGGYNPFMGGGFNPYQQQRPMMGRFNPYQQQRMPFMGGGMGGYNPFMGRGGFNPYQQQRMPFMGGGFNPYQQQRMPFMGGGFNPYMGGGFNPYQQQQDPQAPPSISDLYGGLNEEQKNAFLQQYGLGALPTAPELATPPGQFDPGPGMPDGLTMGTMGGPGYGEYPLGTAGPRVDPGDPNYIPLIPQFPPPTIAPVMPPRPMRRDYGDEEGADFRDDLREWRGGNPPPVPPQQPPTPPPPPQFDPSQLQEIGLFDRIGSMPSREEFEQISRESIPLVPPNMPRSPGVNNQNNVLAPMPMPPGNSSSGGGFPPELLPTSDPNYRPPDIMPGTGRGVEIPMEPNFDPNIMTPMPPPIVAPPTVALPPSIMPSPMPAPMDEETRKRVESSERFGYGGQTPQGMTPPPIPGGGGPTQEQQLQLQRDKEAWATNPRRFTATPYWQAPNWWENRPTPQPVGPMPRLPAPGPRVPAPIPQLPAPGPRLPTPMPRVPTPMPQLPTPPKVLPGRIAPWPNIPKGTGGIKPSRPIKGAPTRNTVKVPPRVMPPPFDPNLGQPPPRVMPQLPIMQPPTPPRGIKAIPRPGARRRLGGGRGGP